MHWVAQISANLLRDEELVDLIAASGGKWIFIGMESIDPANLADVNKGFNKPGEYARRAGAAGAAQRLCDYVLHFRHGQRHAGSGRAHAASEIRTWPPGLPIFGLLTPLPATPLYTRLEAAGRLTRPKHWLEFIPFAMAHTPLKMTIEEAHAEVRYAWDRSYSPEAIAHAVQSFAHKPVAYRINIFIARLCFRGIYFPQMNFLAWMKLIADNRRTIFGLVKEAFATDWGKNPRIPVPPRRRATPGSRTAPAIRVETAEQPSAEPTKSRYLFSETAGLAFGAPTAIQADSRHLPCCLTQTVMKIFCTSAILPRLSARRCMRPSTIAESP